MPISITCSECKRTLKVADTAAGKKVRCPSCKTVVEVPAPEEFEQPDEEFEQPEEEFEQPDEDTAVAAGEPKKKPAWEKDEAVSEGPPKKKPAWEKKKRQDDDEDSNGYGVGEDDDDDEDDDDRPRKRKKKKRRLDFDNDYDRDYREPRGGRRSRGQAHRGILIMVLGIMTILTACLCPLIAWIMGGIVVNMANEDAAKMQSRVMDDSGQGMTTTGKALAIVGIALGLINAILGIALRLGTIR